jgi:hypothetical protein
MFLYCFPCILLICGNVDHIVSLSQEMDARQRRGLAGSPSASVSPQSENNFASRGHGMKSYGFSRRGVRGNFVPPIKSSGGNVGNVTSRIAGKCDDALDDSTKRW